MRILIVNWRDIEHPRAGGAERVTYEMARRWVAWGHEVTWFGASFPGARARETINGIDIWRQGAQSTVHWHAFRSYRRHFAGRVDAILDEVNTIPFLTPLYAHEPVVLYLNQLAREVWFYEAPFPLACAGYVAEPLYLQAYRSVPLMTISQSTLHDARRLGLRGPATVIPMAIDLEPLTALPMVEAKDAEWTVLYVGRVVPSKRVSHIIQALAALRDEYGVAARLWIVGSCSPDYQRTLRRIMAAYQVSDRVTFHGHTSPERKKELLQRAHVLVMASVREGWGLVVSEAASQGTPAVVYNVPGLRDSTIDGSTGLVCRENTPRGLASTLARLHGDSSLYASLRQQAWYDSVVMDWESTAHAGLRALREATSCQEQTRS